MLQYSLRQDFLSTTTLRTCGMLIDVQQVRGNPSLERFRGFSRKPQKAVDQHGISGSREIQLSCMVQILTMKGMHRCMRHLRPELPRFAHFAPIIKWFTAAVNIETSKNLRPLSLSLPLHRSCCHSRCLLLLSRKRIVMT